MSEQTIRRYCSYCEQHRPFVRQSPNHALHLLMSVFTCAVWALFVWLPLIVVSAFKPFRCKQCGKVKI
jgi:hypothetical protein